MLKVGLFPHHLRNTAKEMTAQLKEELKKLGLEIIIRKIVMPDIKFEDQVNDDELVRKSDLVISIGGDGTFLRAARLLSKEKSPAFLLGLSAPGSFGFLNRVNTVKEAVKEVKKFLNNRFTYTTVFTMKATLRTGDNIYEEEFINEVALIRDINSRLPYLSLKMNNLIVGGYQGEGIIISSSVGSTAQSLSIGGSIISHNLTVANIIPFAPHTLNIRPLIVDPEEKPLIYVEGEKETKVHYFIDGSSKAAFYPPAELEVCPGQGKIFLLSARRNYFYRALREKFGWGKKKNASGT